VTSKPVRQESPVSDFPPQAHEGVEVRIQLWERSAVLREGLDLAGLFSWWGNCAQFQEVGE